MSLLGPALAALLAPAVLAPPSFAQQAAGPRPDVVLIVLDDIGVEKLGAYGATPPGLPPPCTPVLDALAASGLLFERCYTDPLCSPSRAQILSGRHGFRTGVGHLVDYGGRLSGLSARSEATLPEILAGYDSAAAGKWHLANPQLDGPAHPFACGFHHYAGSMFNLGISALDLGAGTVRDCSALGRPGYTNWLKSSDPADRGALELTCCTTYATTDTADEAILRARTLASPWFLYVAFNAAHEPFELPPEALCPQPAEYRRALADTAASSPDVAEAMVEALDRELGRMLAEIRRVAPAAYVFVIGDNGTESLAARPSAGGCFDPERSKGTLYEGGIHVPLIVAGPGVVPGRCAALVSSTDLYATIAELAGVPQHAADSISLVPYLRGERRPLRTSVYAEYFSPNFPTLDAPGAPPFAPQKHNRAIRNERYKLVRFTTDRGFENEAFFDLEEDPCEQHDLCPGAGPCRGEGLEEEARRNLEVLRDEMRAMGVY